MNTEEQTYKPGDIVNGHRLSNDASRWEPISPTQTPPPPPAPTNAPVAPSEGNRPSWFARHKVLTAAGEKAGWVEEYL